MDRNAAADGSQPPAIPRGRYGRVRNRGRGKTAPESGEKRSWGGIRRENPRKMRIRRAAGNSGIYFKMLLIATKRIFTNDFICYKVIHGRVG